MKPMPESCVNSPEPEVAGDRQTTEEEDTPLHTESQSPSHSAAEEGEPGSSPQLPPLQLSSPQLPAVRLSSPQLPAVQLSSPQLPAVQLSSPQLSALELSASQLSPHRQHAGVKGTVSRE